MADVKRVYTFGNKEAEGNGKMRELLGGKGANLAEMNLIGIPVPPGFTITTDTCSEYYKEGKERVIELLRPEVEAAIQNIEKLTGRKFNDTTLPLLVPIAKTHFAVLCAKFMSLVTIVTVTTTRITPPATARWTPADPPCSSTSSRWRARSKRPCPL